MEDPTWRKANFLWKFLCAGGASLDYGGDPIPTAVPPQGFLQSKNALRRRRLPNLLPGSLIVVRTANRFAIADQSESAGKNRRSLPQWLDTSCLEPMGSHKGPQTLVLCCAASATKAISSRRLDTALLFADKKRGVEKNQLAGLCQNLPRTTGPAKSPSLPAGSKNKNPLPIRENIRYNITCPHSGQEDETWQNSISNTARWVRARPRPR